MERWKLAVLSSFHPGDCQYVFCHIWGYFLQLRDFFSRPLEQFAAQYVFAQSICIVEGEAYTVTAPVQETCIFGVPMNFM